MSTLTAYTPIPENSAATPGLWDVRFQNQAQNLTQVNSDLTVSVASLNASITAISALTLSGSLATVPDTASRETRYPSSSAAGQMVVNFASSTIEALRSDKTWQPITDSPHRVLTPQQYALQGWFDSKGRNTIGFNRDDFITQAEISANTWLKGSYYHGIHTRDDVALQEMVINAYAPSSVSGNYQWIGGGVLGAGNRCYIPPGYYKKATTWWIGPSVGANIEGERFGSIIESIVGDTRIVWADGVNGATFATLQTQPKTSWRGTEIANDFWHMTWDIDDFGTSSAGDGPQLNMSYNTAMTITEVVAPGLYRVGSSWDTNSLHEIVIVDDPGNANAIGQHRYVTWNSAETIFIRGRWEYSPSTQAKFVIDPLIVGWSRWHSELSKSGSTRATLCDWLTNFNSSSVSTQISGATVYKYKFQATGEYDEMVVHSHTTRVISMTTQWSYRTHLPRKTNNDDHSALGFNGLAQTPCPKGRGSNYCIGGTLYDGTSGHTITGYNENCFGFTGASLSTNSYIGSYIEIVSGNTMAPTTVLQIGSNSFGSSVVTVAAASNRSVGLDFKKRLFVYSGLGSTSSDAPADWAVIRSNNSKAFVLDHGLNIDTASKVEVVDPVVGQKLPVAQQSQTTIWTTYEPGSGPFHQYFWTLPPKAGDKFRLIGRTSNLLLQGVILDRVHASGNNVSDLNMSFCRSGDNAMGSESRLEDVQLQGSDRVAFYSNGLNVINIFLDGGASGEPSEHAIYIPRGSAGIRGFAFGGGFDGQVGHDIRIGTQDVAAVNVDNVRSENFNLVDSGVPLLLLNCINVAAPPSKTTTNRVWLEGEVYTPTIWNGMPFRCVETFGAGSTASCVEPTQMGLGAVYSILTDSSGSGAAFVRMDYEGFSAEGSVSMALLGSFPYARPYTSGTFIPLGTQFNRPDYNGGGAGKNAANAISAVFGMPRCNTFLAGDYGTQNLRGNPGQNNNTINGLQSMNQAVMPNVVLMHTGNSGTEQQSGLALQTTGESNVTQMVLSILDYYTGTRVAREAILGKLAPTGSNLSGADQIIAPGQSTGTQQGGVLRLWGASTGTASSAVTNSFVSVLAIDLKTVHMDSNATLNLNQGHLLSVRTAASLDSTSLLPNEVAFTIAGASGASLAIRSGGTVWYFSSSASTKG